MNVKCREQFVHLHAQPLLNRLARFFELHYGGREFEQKVTVVNEKGVKVKRLEKRVC